MKNAGYKILLPETPTAGEVFWPRRKAGAFYGKWLPQLAVGKGQNPSSYDEFGDLAKHLRFAERGSRKLARSTFWGMSRWQAALEKRQAWLGRIVDIGAELFAISSACVYANTLAEEQPDRADEARELADLFCIQARRRVERPVPRPVGRTTTTRTTPLALKVLDGRYTLIEEGILDPSGDGPMIAEPEENEAPAVT